MARTVTVQLTVGGVRLGGWCDSCAKSSRVECDVYMLRDDGPHRLGTYSQCADCGES